MVHVIRDNNLNKGFIFLIKELDIYLNELYGIVQAQYNGYNQIENIETVVVAYDGNIPAGCACFKQFDKGSAEVKRMFVRKEYRGQNIAQLIHSEIEEWAKEKGFKHLILETGIKQAEAIRFYTKIGYEKIDNYGQYIDNTNSICMSKRLNP